MHFVSLSEEKAAEEEDYFPLLVGQPALGHSLLSSLSWAGGQVAIFQGGLCQPLSGMAQWITTWPQRLGR